VYISKSNSGSKSQKSEESEQASSSSSSPAEQPEEEEEDSRSDSEDSVKDQYRRAEFLRGRPFSEDSEEDSEDEWSDFLSSSAKKQRRQSPRSSSDGPSTSSHTEDTGIPSTPTTSQSVALSIAHITHGRPLQLNPIRNRPERSMLDDEIMMDDEMDGHVMKVKDGFQDEGHESELSRLGGMDPVIPAGEEILHEPEPPRMPEVQEEIIDMVEEQNEVDLNIGDKQQSSIEKELDATTEIQQDQKSIDTSKSPTDDTVVQDVAATEMIDAEEKNFVIPQPDTQAEMTEEVEKESDSLQPSAPSQIPFAEDLPPTADTLPIVDAPPVAKTAEEDVDMTAEEIHEEPPASTPAGTSIAGIEEGEEELDEDAAPSPEAEDGETAEGVADVEMGETSVSAEAAPAEVVKIRKKPGPKPKPKQVGQKVEAAAKKSAKGIKGKKVDELKTTSKSKNARFTPVS
jgi:hypothetical protein